MGIGTLFNYAEDKRDLVFLIFNDELAALTAAALHEAQPDVALAEQVIAVFGLHYRYFAANPVLSRILLQELTFYSTGKQAEAFLRIRQRLIDGIEQLVQTAQRERRILSQGAGRLHRAPFLLRVLRGGSCLDRQRTARPGGGTGGPQAVARSADQWVVPGGPAQTCTAKLARAPRRCG